jgi:hypothetical protein
MKGNIQYQGHLIIKGVFLYDEFQLICLIIAMYQYFLNSKNDFILKFRELLL